jgi:hypothetical protein
VAYGWNMTRERLFTKGFQGLNRFVLSRSPKRSILFQHFLKLASIFGNLRNEDPNIAHYTKKLFGSVWLLGFHQGIKVGFRKDKDQVGSDHQKFSYQGSKFKGDQYQISFLIT